MKGILLAGGSGTRIYPLSKYTSKQLLPVYDKPLIYYSLSVLLLAGIKEILIISTPHDLPFIKRLLNDGSDLGLKLEYLPQEKPLGIAHAFILGEQFINDAPVCLILGDNLFFAQDFADKLEKLSSLQEGATVLAYHVADPSAFGVVEFNEQGKAVDIEEKPKAPKSSYAVPGLYFYDRQAVKFSKKLAPSPRGELEITDLNKMYISKKQLTVEILGRGTAWLDLGTFDNLLLAGQFVQTLEKRQNLKIGCIEEISLRKGYIDLSQFNSLISKMPKSTYKDYLNNVLREF